MFIALLGCVLSGSITYDPRKSSLLRDPAALTTDGELRSAGSPLILSSAITPLGVATAWDKDNETLFEWAINYSRIFVFAASVRT